METETADISSLLKEKFLSCIREERNGLVLVTPPTSSGKTYAACLTMAASCMDPESEEAKAFAGRQALFVTPLLKNLPEDSLRKIFTELGLDYDRNVLLVKSNRDCIADAFTNDVFGHIPLHHQGFLDRNGNLKRLMNLAEQFVRHPDQNDELSKYKQREFEISERNFRKDIYGLLQRIAEKDAAASETEKETEKKSIRETLIAHSGDSDDNTRWIEEIYPQVRDDRYRILLMSSMKLLEGRRIITGSGPYLSPDWLANKVVFLDEFDSVKQDMKKCIINSTFDPQADYDPGQYIPVKTNILDLFDYVSRALLDMERRYPSDLKMTRHWLWTERKELLGEAEKIRAAFRTDAPYKYDDDAAVDPEHEGYQPRTFFLFYCGDWHTVINGSESRQQLFARYDRKGNRMQIRCGRRKDLKPGDVMLKVMLEELDRFIGKSLRFFQFYAFYRMQERSRAEKEALQAAGKTTHPVSDDGEQAAVRADGRLSYRETISSIISLLPGLKEKINTLLRMYGLDRRSSLTDRSRTLRREHPYFSSGFKWFSLENSTMHDENTSLMMVRVADTPEEILLTLCRSALVIGMSATADCPTVTGNFCLDYVKENLPHKDLPDSSGHEVRFRSIPEDDDEAAGKVRAWVSARRTKYDDGSIRVSITKLKNSCGLPELSGELLKLLKRPESTSEEDWDGFGTMLARKVFAMIERPVRSVYPDAADEHSVEYFCTRYFNIFRTMVSFAANRDHQSCLLLQRPLPAEGNPLMDMKCIRELINIANAYSAAAVKGWDDKTDSISLSILGGGGRQYDRAEAQLRKELESGSRKFIMSSYASVAEGVNLQHKISGRIAEDPESFLAELPGARSTSLKDIDEIALLETTHLVSNLNEPRFSIRDQLANIMQAEESADKGILSPRSRDELVSAGFTSAGQSRITGRHFENPLSLTVEPGLAATSLIIQATGRINRTSMRPVIVQMYIDEKLLSILDTGYLRTKFPYLSPEMRAICGLAEEQEALPAEHTEIEKEAELDTLSSAVHFRELLASINLRSGTDSWHEKTEEWKSCRICSLAAPQTKADGYGRFPDLRRFYIKAPHGTKRYWYCEADEFGKVRISFNGRNGIKERLKKEPDDTLSPRKIHEVSAEAARLGTLLRYKSMREFFALPQESGPYSGISYAAQWEEGEYMLNPLAFQEIYLGALGEEAGRFILRDFGIETDAIGDDRFELMDAMVRGFPDVYIDYKYYKYCGSAGSETRWQVTEENRKKILKKARRLRARAVFIIGIILPEEKVESRIEAYPERGLRVFYVPGLMNPDGSAAMEMISFIRERLAELREEEGKS